MRVVFRIIGLVSLLAIVSSCSTGACYDDIDPLLNVELFADGTEVALKADSLLIIGENYDCDTVLVDEKSVSSFSLMLNPASQNVTLYIYLNDMLDTAVINYDNYPHLVSAECGYTLFSTITGLTTTHHIIDSLNIENENVTLDGTRNLRLFY